jgi:membrane protease YdiL (CAAX protease family)
LQQKTTTVGEVTISRGMQFALFVVALLWAGAANSIAAKSARGIAVRLQMGSVASLLSGAFLLFLAVVGFQMLDWIATRSRYAGETLPLPVRPGWLREWGVGAAIGWGLAIASVLPLLLTGNLHARLGWQPGSAQAIAVALGTLLLATLAEEVVFRGYPFRRLIAAVGPSAAAVLMSVLFAALIVQANPPHNVLVALIDCTFFGLLLAMAWLRTHALWLGWGLHFAYRAVAAVVLGLPIAGHGEFGSPTDMYATGPRWLSGGAFGLDAALLTGLVMLAGMIVLYRETRDYAWKYTHPPIIAGGYEVVVAPPAAHVAMEKAAAPPPLVQILPSTPQSRSVTESTVDMPRE